MQGPHAVIAGAMGYGKSEFIISYILSLAVNYHPEDVGIVLIDCNGGDLAYEFDGLPHMLGAITGSGDESLHLITALQSEFRRRQRILGEYQVSHTNYLKLFRQGDAETPLPHLIVICDDIAVMQREHFEYLRKIWDITARYGDKLGIHAIFVTSRPSEVNAVHLHSACRSRICFKVEDEEESRDILKSKRAANLTDEGRAYLQAGDAKIWELFQAAWSGAPLPDPDKRKSGGFAYETQCENIVRHIIGLCESENISGPERLWLPLMPIYIVSPYTQKDIIRTPGNLDMALGIGLIDDVETKSRGEYTIDFMRNGHVLYMASAGHGKTTFLQSILLGLSIKNSVKDLEIYILDMGKSLMPCLMPFRKLNHVVEYLDRGDMDGLDRFSRRMEELMAERRALLDSTASKNFLEYNRSYGPHLPAIIIAIDDYEHKDEQMPELIKRIAAEGCDLGIYLAVTLAHTGAMTYLMMENFKERIAGFNYAESEITDLFLGQEHIRLTEGQPGRALTDMDGVKLMQLYTPVSDERDLAELGTLIAAINAVSKGTNN